MGRPFRRKGRKGWTVAFWENGRKVFRSKPTYAEAEAENAKAVQRALDGVIGDDPAFEPYARACYKHLAASGELSAGTLDLYRKRLDRHVVPYFKAFTLRELDRRHVKEFIGTRLELGLTRKTVRGILGVLRAVLEEGVRDGLLAKNVAASGGLGLGTSRAERAAARDKIKALDREQLDRFMAAAAAWPRWALAFRLQVLTGLRPGELLGAQWGDLDFPASTLYVARQVTAHGVGPTKTGTAAPVDVPPGVLEALRSHDAHTKAVALAAGRERAAWIFAGPRDRGHLTHAALLRAFRVITKKAGLPQHFTPHCMRHTFATQHLIRGAEIYYVQRQLRHASIKMTVDRYGSWLPAGNQARAAQLEADLGLSPRSHYQPSVDAVESR